MSFLRVPGEAPPAEREPRPLVVQPAPRLVLVPRHHPLRAASEACIRTVYEQAFGARDLVLPPLLLARVAPDGDPVCAAGMRTEADGFFSEVYLDMPIEQALARRAGRPVARAAVMEVTTLASLSVDASSAFVRQIAGFGKETGFAWSFFTATGRLRRLLGRLGIPTFVLAKANASRVADPERWGSYYRHAPHVCAVHGDWVDDDAVQERERPRHA